MKRNIVILLLFPVIIYSLLKSYSMNEQKQTMKAPSLWNIITHQKEFIQRESIQKLFLEDIKENLSENIHIPSKTNNTLRIINFNVRMWTNLANESNFDQIGNLIKNLDPDIIVMQEVTDWEKTLNYYTNLGFNKKAASCITKNPPFGPAIFVKNYPVNNIYSSTFKNQYNPSRELSFVRLDFKINNQDISVYGTHLEVDQHNTKESVEHIREKQLEEIFTDIKNLGHSNIIIAGDFNSLREKDYTYKVNDTLVWQIIKNRFQQIFSKIINPTVLDLFARNEYISSFELLNWKSPKFTNWAGFVLDFIFISQKFSLPLLGSYIYYTDLSDHLPIIVDIKI